MLDLYFVDHFLLQLLIFAMTILVGITIYFLIKQIIDSQQKEQKALTIVQQNYQEVMATYEKTRLSKDQLYQRLAQGAPNSMLRQQLMDIYRITRMQQAISPSYLQDLQLNQQKATVANFFIHYTPILLLLLGGVGLFFGTQAWLASGQQSGLLQPAFLPFFWSMVGITLLTLVQFPSNWFKQQADTSNQHFLSTQILPLFNPLKSEQQLNELAHTVNTHTQAMYEVVNKLQLTTQGLGNDLEQMHQAARHLQTSITVYADGQNKLHQTISKLSSIVSAYKAQLDTNHAEHQQIVEGLNLHNATIEQINARLLQTEFNVGDWIKQIIGVSHEQQVGFKEEMQTILKVIRSNQSHIQSVVNNFRVTIDRFVRKLEAIEGDFNPFQQAITNASETEINKLNQLSVQIMDIHKLLYEVNANVPNQLTTLANLLNRNYTALDPNHIDQITHRIAEQKIQERIGNYEQEQQLALERKRQNSGIRGMWNGLLGKKKNQE